MSASAALPLAKDEWKLKVNAQYQEAIKLLANLVTASLILPIVFVKNFVGVKDSESIAGHLNARAYWGWGFLFASVVCGGVFYWASAKYVKLVCGGKESWSEDTYEIIRDASIFGMVVSFVVGLAVLLSWFACEL